VRRPPSLRSGASLEKLRPLRAHPVRAARSALEAIVGKYKLSPADVDALFKWRHSHDF